MRLLYGVLSTASLLSCSYIPVGYISGLLPFDEFKNLLLAGSIWWTIFATLWVTRGRVTVR